MKEKQWLSENPNEVVEMVDALPDVFAKDELGQLATCWIIAARIYGNPGTHPGGKSVNATALDVDRLQLRKFFQQEDVLEVSRLCVTKDADAVERMP